MKVVFPLTQVVIAIGMVVSSILETTLSSGVLPITTAASPMPGTATWAAAIAVTGAAAIAVWAGTPATSPLAPLFVASGIDYLTICG